jgi:hypothetical protein
MRVFSLALGLGAGVVLGVAAVRRIDEAQRAVAPTAVADRLGRGAGDVLRRVRLAAAEGRAAAEAHEARLREDLEVAPLGEVLRR